MIVLSVALSTYVALHPEGVDRNWGCFCWAKYECDVALHPEGVDRNNPERLVTAEKAQVALHPEGVDRNKRTRTFYAEMVLSPSTRRAWIEINKEWIWLRDVVVALHPEGVDRNWNG